MPRDGPCLLVPLDAPGPAPLGACPLPRGFPGGGQWLSGQALMGSSLCGDAGRPGQVYLPSWGGWLLPGAAPTWSLPALSTCSGGRWRCQEVQCPGTCSVLGGAHFSTFDERQYTVHGDCSYVLAKVHGPRVLPGQSGFQVVGPGVFPQPELHVGAAFGATLGSPMPSPPGNHPSSGRADGWWGGERMRRAGGAALCVRTCVSSPVTAAPSPCWPSCAGVD